MSKRVRVYELDVVKGDQVIRVPDSNHSSQMLREAQSDRFLGSHKGVGHAQYPCNESVAGWEKYSVTATDPLSLTKGKNK